MSATPQDVQTKIAEGLQLLEATTTPGAKWVQQHGADWTKWPTTSKWYQAFSLFHQASDEAGQLVVNTLAAGFTSKVG